MESKERNRRIKKELVKMFGYDNVLVKGGRGTAYGWVKVTIKRPRPHAGECEPPLRFGLCQKCRKEIEETKRRVWKMLKETELINEIGTYYDDFNNRRYEILIKVNLVEGLE